MVTKKWCARKDQSLLFDLIKSGHTLCFFFSEKTIFLNACATCSELPSNIGSMVLSLMFTLSLLGKCHCMALTVISLFSPLLIFFRTKCLHWDLNFLALLQKAESECSKCCNVNFCLAQN